jgi:hypothetical protein
LDAFRYALGQVGEIDGKKFHAVIQRHGFVLVIKT